MIFIFRGNTTLHGYIFIIPRGKVVYCFTHVCLSGRSKDFLATINSEISFKISFILKTLKMNDLHMIEAVHVSKTSIFQCSHEKVLADFTQNE